MRKLGTKGKRALVGVSVGALVIGGLGFGGYKLYKDKSKTNVPSEEPSTSIEQQTENTFILPAFSIEDENAVAARALYISDKSNGAVPIDEIVDAIYYINERPDLMKGPKTYEYAKQIVEDVATLLSTNVLEFSDHIKSSLENKELNDVSNLELIYSSLFISDSYADRDKAVQMDKLYNTYIIHVEDGNYNLLHEDAKAICDTYLELKESNLSVATGYMITFDKYAKLLMYSVLLNDDMLDKMSNNDQNTYSETLSAKYTLVNNIDKQPLIDEGLVNGFDANDKNIPADAKNVTKNSDGSADYRSDSHAQASDSGNESGEKLDDPKEVEQGGKPVETETSTNEPTTSVETENIQSSFEPTTSIEEEYGYIDEDGNWVPVKFDSYYVDSSGYVFNPKVKTLK